jgi:triacylglycerol esterase/lipase EstA (alpha/beta hydrolase family)
MSNLEKGLASSVTFGFFAAVIQTKWPSRGDWRFWAIIAAFALLHIVVLITVRFQQVRAGLISLPFALVDGFVMWGLINWVDKHFPRASNLT